MNKSKEKLPLFCTTNTFSNKKLQNKEKLDFFAMADKHNQLKSTWKICIEHPFRNCEKIHPLQQKKVQKLLQTLEKDNNIKKMTIFGSSVENRCHVDSDVDFYVELFSERKVSLPLCDFSYDMWTNYTVDSRMLKEIKRKGVIVYERNIAG